MRGIRIGSAFGIPIRLDLTFLLVLPLFAWLIGSDVAGLAGTIDLLFGTDLAAAPLTDIQWTLGVAAALGLFAGVLLHEFGHSLVAMHYGYEIESITLWLFGGVARFTEMPEDWKQELVIALAGPAVSVAVGVVSYVGFVALPVSQTAARFVLGYLALTNVLLAAFNLLPGFPMDGGRVLRALLARNRNRSHARATQLAAEVGKAFAFLLGIVGLFANLFLVALAFFIYMGASSEAQQTVMKAAFQDVTVRDIMTPRDDLDTVAEDTTVAQLMQRMFRERHTGYPVLRNGHLVGMVTLNDARGVNEVERDAYLVEDVMADDLRTIAVDADAMDAISTMQEAGVGRLPVVDAEGDLVGLVSRSDLVTAFNIIQSQGSLGASARRDTRLSNLRSP